MVEDYQTFVAFRCPQCGEIGIEKVGLFCFSGGAKVILSCSCGAECVEVGQVRDRYSLQVLCAACLDLHTYSMGRAAFFGKLLTTFYCPDTQIGVLSVGREALALEDMRRQNDAFLELFGEAGLSPKGGMQLASEQVMLQTIDRIHELASLGNVYCTCGCHDISFRINFDSVELVCDRCGVFERIAAANEEDLSAIRDRELIVIPGRAPRPSRRKTVKLSKNFRVTP